MGGNAYFGPVVRIDTSKYDKSKSLIETGQFNTMYQWVTRSNEKMMIIMNSAVLHLWTSGRPSPRLPSPHLHSRSHRKKHHRHHTPPPPATYHSNHSSLVLPAVGLQLLLSWGRPT